MRECHAYARYLCIHRPAYVLYSNSWIGKGKREKTFVLRLRTYVRKISIYKRASTSTQSILQSLNLPLNQSIAQLFNPPLNQSINLPLPISKHGICVRCIRRSRIPIAKLNVVTQLHFRTHNSPSQRCQLSIGATAWLRGCRCHLHFMHFTTCYIILMIQSKIS
ncbi:hypothetical protein L211DRAFT_315340 [Terfezia boudieri ATCC MYA-4762]|uniref:Uncharacterized protein n=1 Tax=Terfezia boudieri ATCC MYA-4762 TaxID=1051890 RepID=A0A3N4LIC4_9PEZI|nr:hypothetical protein L211DRAFT_315340 [Terfezia boudieri ATCC MYA-4762]